MKTDEDPEETKVAATDDKADKKKRKKKKKKKKQKKNMPALPSLADLLNKKTAPAFLQKEKALPEFHDPASEQHEQDKAKAANMSRRARRQEERDFHERQGAAAVSAARKAKDAVTFRQREARKRKLGQVSRGGVGGNYVENEKRLLREMGAS